MSILESKIERTVVKYAKERGYICLKLSPTASRGWPDHVFISPSGVHIYMEFKQKGKVPTKLQLEREKQLRKQWCHVYSPVDTVALGKSILNQYA